MDRQKEKTAIEGILGNSRFFSFLMPNFFLKELFLYTNVFVDKVHVLNKLLKLL